MRIIILWYNQGLKYHIYRISVRGDTISAIDNRLWEKIEKKNR